LFCGFPYQLRIPLFFFDGDKPGICRQFLKNARAGGFRSDTATITAALVFRFQRFSESRIINEFCRTRHGGQ
jgi:hypothetical protein